MTKPNNIPGFKEGLKGIVLEPIYMIRGKGVRCPECSSTWGGYYATYMNFCHFCGCKLYEL